MPDDGVKKTDPNRIGQGKPGPGRPAGIPNKATTRAREAFARFVDGNAGRLQEWLDEIKEEQGAEKAFRCFMEVAEYHVPKLARSEIYAELTGKDGEALFGEAQLLRMAEEVVRRKKSE